MCEVFKQNYKGYGDGETAWINDIIYMRRHLAAVITADDIGETFETVWKRL